MLGFKHKICYFRDNWEGRHDDETFKVIIQHTIETVGTETYSIHVFFSYYFIYKMQTQIQWCWELYSKRRNYILVREISECELK